MSRLKYFGRPAQGAIRFGTNTLVNGDTITIGGRVYEFRTSGSATPPNVQVNVGGSAALTAVALRDAINANKPTIGVTATIDPVDTAVVRLKADVAGAAGNLALAEAVADAGIIVSGANLTQGQNGSARNYHFGTYVVTALDVLATNVVIETGLPAAVEFAQLHIKSATGLFKGTLTGLITKSGAQIRHDFAGATDLVAGDLIEWVAA